MIDPSESIARLNDPEYRARLLNLIVSSYAALDPSSVELSQHDKTMLNQFGELVVWAVASEEQAFTGDPTPPPPDYPILRELVKRLEPLVNGSDEQV